MKYINLLIALVVFLLDVVTLIFLSDKNGFLALFYCFLSIFKLIFIFYMKRNILLYFFIFYISFSLNYYNVIASLFSSTLVYNSNNIVVSLFGQILCLVVLVVFYKIKGDGVLLQNLKNNKEIHHFGFETNTIIYFFIAYLFSFLSLNFGVSKMGMEQEITSNGMVGILNVARIFVIPLIFPVIYFSSKYKKIVISVFIIWLFFETFIRSSRGAILNGLLPFIVYYYYCFGLRKKEILSIFVLLVFCVILYPIVTVMRYGFDSIETGLNEVSIGFFDVYRRVFLAGHIINNFLTTYPEKIWSGENISIIFENYGSLSKYTTFNLDKFSSGISHSSGMTFFSEGLILFGLKGLFIYTIFLSLVLRFFSEKSISPVKKMLMFFLVYNFLQQGFVEFMFQQWQYFFSLLFLFIMAHNKGYIFLRGK